MPLLLVMAGPVNANEQQRRVVGQRLVEFGESRHLRFSVNWPGTQPPIAVIQAPPATVWLRARKAAWTSATLAVSDSRRVSCPGRSLSSTKWLWLSIRPGTTVRPCTSITFFWCTVPVETIAGRKAPVVDGHGGHDRVVRVHGVDAAVDDPEVARSGTAIRRRGLSARRQRNAGANECRDYPSNCPHTRPPRTLHGSSVYTTTAQALISSSRPPGPGSPTCRGRRAVPGRRLKRGWCRRRAGDRENRAASHDPPSCSDSRRAESPTAGGRSYS